MLIIWCSQDTTKKEIIYQSLLWPVVWHSCINWFKSLQSVLVCWFLTDTCLVSFAPAGYSGMCVLGSGRDGAGGDGVSAQFLVWEFALRVIFLKKFYQWSYIYLKTFDCETCFLSWWYLKAKKRKSGQYGTFLCHIFLGQGGGLNISTPLLDDSLIPWMNEWVLLGVALPDFPWKHCTPSLSQKKKIFHVRDVSECKTWISPLYTPFFW